MHLLQYTLAESQGPLCLLEQTNSINLVFGDKGRSEDLLLAICEFCEDNKYAGCHKENLFDPATILLSKTLKAGAVFFRNDN